jgi:nicotinamidase-related amidase
MKPDYELPIPDHFDPEKVNQVWRVLYEQLAQQAQSWRDRHHIQPAIEDDFRTALFIVDNQNTFCLPEFELFVAGRSGTGAIEDTRRLVEFLYRNLGVISEITVTMDTHQATQIFHSIFFINDQGEHPDPLTQITVEDIQEGRWKFNPAVAASLAIDPQYGQQHVQSYVEVLSKRQKFDLTIWPYHSMLGGIGHALVPSLEEALFFYTVARYQQPNFILKARNPLTERYSALSPEVTRGPDGRKLGEKNTEVFEQLQAADAFVIAGQAKSHCVAWTIEDLLADIRQQDESLVDKIYLLEDCTSPVVVPDVVDYTEQAEAAFERFTKAGMHRVRSTEPIASWPGIKILASQEKASMV